MSTLAGSSLANVRNRTNGLLSTIGDFSDKNDSLTDEGRIMKKARNDEMSQLPNDSVCSTSFDNEDHRFCQPFAQVELELLPKHMLVSGYENWAYEQLVRP